MSYTDNEKIFLTDLEKNELIKRIDLCRKNKGISSLNVVFIESGVGKNFKSNLKTSQPSRGKLTLIANYLDVTVDHLLGKEEKTSVIINNKHNNNLTEHEQNLIHAYRSKPEMQPAVDRLLGIEEGNENTVYYMTYQVAESLDNHEGIIEMDAERWNQMEDTPKTDDELL